jgi:hypothetical protein
VREVASAFLRDHFHQWCDQTRAVEEVHKDSGIHLLAFANILPSGAWTGSWCSVILDSQRGGIVGFCQEIAARDVPESAVLMGGEAAEKAALDEILTTLPHGWTAAPGGRRLVLSSRIAPDRGPIWAVDILVNPQERPMEAEGRTVYVDGMTGKVVRNGGG